MLHCYIGEGVICEFDGTRFRLHRSERDDVTSEIFMDGVTMRALVDFVDRVKREMTMMRA
jgi:hypothetical protein